MSKEWKTYFKLFAMILLCLSLYPKVAVALESQTNTKMIYEGYYTCSQGKTDLKLIFNEDLNSAIFDFNYDNKAKGSFELESQFSADQLVLKAKDWIVRPDRYSTVDLKGKFNGDFTKISGDVLNDNCGSFEVQLMGNNASNQFLKEKMVSLQTKKYFDSLNQKMIDDFNPLIFEDEQNREKNIQELFTISLGIHDYECLSKLIANNKFVSKPKRNLEQDVNLIISECGYESLPKYDLFLSKLVNEDLKKKADMYKSLKSKVIDVCSQRERLVNRIINRGYAGSLLGEYKNTISDCTVAKLNLSLNLNIENFPTLLKQDYESFHHMGKIENEHQKICNLRDVTCKN